MPQDGQIDLTRTGGISLAKGCSAHLVGICGAGMKALAELLDGVGWTLSGSDLLPANPSIQLLGSRGLQFFVGHAADNVPHFPIGHSRSRLK